MSGPFELSSLEATTDFTLDTNPYTTSSISQEMFAAICSGGLGIHQSTPPPDSPPPNAVSMKQIKASPTHSLSTSLSTPPSSPPEVHQTHHSIEDDILDFIQADLNSKSHATSSGPAKDWDALDLDLFGENLAASAVEADAFFDSAFFN